MQLYGLSPGGIPVKGTGGLAPARVDAALPGEIPERGRGVALVFPYLREEQPVEAEKLFPPLSVAYLSSQLKERSVPVSVHDGTFRSPGEIVRDVAREEPAIVSIYLMITMVRNGLYLLGSLKQLLPDTLFITGGPLPTLYPERFAGSFDVVFRGEGDLTVARFCDKYRSAGCTPADLSGLDLPTYPGIYRHRGNTVISTAPVHHPVEVIESLPLPDRSGFDHRRYQEFWGRTAGSRMTTILITRGCPYSCDFCSKPVWGNDYRKPSLDRVFAEIRDILALGYDRLWIADDSFTLDTGYLREFCTRKVRERLPFTWVCLSRVDRLDSAIVGLMRDAGCVRVYLGLESGNDGTLRLMGKKATIAEGIEAVRLFRQAGIETSAFFIVGYPGETEQSVDDTLELASSLPLDEISINVPFPLPGSPLFSRVGSVDTSADWDRANDITFIYRSEFDESVLREKIRQAGDLFRERKRERKEREKQERFSPGKAGNYDRQV
jgi:anaerobic magnesium-protoporphyrin IX monomethyl ester cyclase